MFRILHSFESGTNQGKTVRFDGQSLGGPVSFFLVDVGPGTGSALHIHPYSETWVIRDGEAEFEVGGETARASSGDIIVAAANTPHRFTNVGADRLRLICIHPHDTIVQQAV